MLELPPSQIDTQRQKIARQRIADDAGEPPTGRPRQPAPPRPNAWPRHRQREIHQRRESSIPQSAKGMAAAFGGSASAYIELLTSIARKWPRTERVATGRRMRNARCVLCGHGRNEGVSYRSDDAELVRDRRLPTNHLPHPVQAKSTRPTSSACLLDSCSNTLPARWRAGGPPAIGRACMATRRQRLGRIPQSTAHGVGLAAAPTELQRGCGPYRGAGRDQFPSGKWRRGPREDAAAAELSLRLISAASRYMQ